MSIISTHDSPRALGGRFTTAKTPAFTEPACLAFLHHSTVAEEEYQQSDQAVPFHTTVAVLVKGA